MVKTTTFGQWVKQRRKALGLTQSELARRAPCSQVMIKKIEADLRLPSVQLARLLAHHLRITPQDYATFFHLARPDLPAEAFDASLAAEAMQPLQRFSRRGKSLLPTPSTPLLGRAQELENICALLRRPRVRLVTLTGPGGAGKTRLALETATALLSDFSDGVYFINLAPINNSSLVLPTIAQALGIKETQPGAIQNVLGDYLSDRELLLVLDNFEQVLAAAKDIAAVLSMAPDLKVLVTSRTRLHLSGEYEFVVSPLELPDLRQFIFLDVLLRSPAIALFIQRGQAARADFTLTRENALIIAQICARLDGLPLAIELAAARIKFMSPQTLLARLNGNDLEAPLDLLSGGVVDLPDRHQTIRHTIDWSYQLLNTAEQRLFRCLGVMKGGCTLNAAVVIGEEAEIHTPADVLANLSSLVDQSLLQQTEDDKDGQPRYSMLETLREYAQERLNVQGELASLQHRHALFFLELAEVAQSKSEGLEQADWLRQLEIEQDNLRAALDWSCTCASGIEVGLRLAAALWDFWLVRGYVQEGRIWLDKVLSRSQSSPPSRARAEALNGAGLLAWAQDDIQQAMALLEESLAIFRSLDDKLGSAWALSHLGDVALRHGRYDLAVQCCTESRLLFHAANAAPRSGWALLTLGNAVWAQGQQVQAIAYLDEGLALFQQLGDRQGMAWVKENLGCMIQAQGDHTRAEDLLTKSLDIFQEVGDKVGTAWALNHLGRLAQAQGKDQKAQSVFRDSMRIFHELHVSRGVGWGLVGLASIGASPEQAALLLGAAQRLFDTYPQHVTPAEQDYYRQVLTITTRNLDTAQFAAAYSRGQDLGGNDAVRYALEQGELSDDDHAPVR